MWAEETPTVRFPSLSSEISGFEPELVTAASGASVLRGRRRPASVLERGVVEASLMLRESKSAEVDFGATVNKSRLENRYDTGSAGKEPVKKMKLKLKHGYIKTESLIFL